MPARVAALPRNLAGYPIPWFVAHLPDGTRDFRIAGTDPLARAVKDRLCWVCGHRLGKFMAFTIGPMCAMNQLSSEPPSHRECAEYAAKVCPFLATPQMRRRPLGEQAETELPAGEMIERNPGVALVWVTCEYTAFHPERGQPGVLFRIGPPTETLWYAQGRPATRAEILDAIQAGLPELVEACQRDERPNLALLELDREVQRVLTLIPA